MYPFGETVVLITRGAATGRDADGNDVHAPVETVLDFVPVWPRASSESVQGQDTTVIGITALVPADTDVSSIDALRVYGVTYEVDGEPGRYRSPLTGSNPGIELQLKRVTG